MDQTRLELVVRSATLSRQAKTKIHCDKGMNMMSRRNFSKAASLGAAGIALAGAGKALADHHEETFEISLAEWSLQPRPQSWKDE